MNGEAPASNITSRNRADFHSSLREIQVASTSRVNPAILCCQIADKLHSAPLPEAEKALRLTSVLWKLRLGNKELEVLARHLSTLSSSLKNACSPFLPDTLRPILYGKDKSFSAAAEAGAVPSKELTPQVAPPLSEPQDSKEDGAFATVLLMATNDQAANKGLLDKSGFKGIQIESIDKFEVFTTSEIEICGCIIDGSILQDRSADGQQELLTKIFRFSNFTWIRIQRDGLKLSTQDVAAAHREACCDPRSPSIERIHFSETGLLAENELPNLTRARQPLELYGKGGRIVSLELTNNQAAILMASISKSQAESALGQRLELASLRTKWMLGGRTSAKVAEVKINHNEIPLVAKIDTKDAVLEEVRRFRHFVAPADNSLKPEIYFHQSCGVIVFGLVNAGADDLVSPAPQLEKILCDLWIHDIYGEAPTQTDVDDATTAIRSALEKIRFINQRNSFTTEFSNLANPRIDVFRRIEERGLTFGLSKQVIDFRDMCDAKIKTLADCAPVHGDIHLRNILVRSGREAHLIDYSRSGPGHPAVDAVRLELALYLSAFRPTENFDRILEMQRLINDVETNAEHLLKSFPDLSRWAVNRVCLSGMIAARDTALKILARFKGGPSDYYAVKCLVCWEALVVSDLQFGLAVSALNALQYQKI